MILVLAAVAVCGACGRVSGDSGFTPTFATKEAAAEAVVAALAARDVERLGSLAVTEPEFRTRVWPELPASHPDVGMPLDYLWAETHLKSRGYMGQALRDFGGTPMTVQAVRFLGRTTDYGSFRVHAKTQLTVRTPDGRVRDLRLFGSMLEADGRWKVFSYVVD